jgi:hypothetical protein
VLIDGRHKGWILWTGLAAVGATALYIGLDRRLPGGVTGGTVAGLWYGIVGSALMVYAGLLSTLRRVPSWWWVGSRKVWLRGHIWLGLLSELFILLHSGFRWGGMLERVLWVILTLTIVTGIVGLAIQKWVPRMLTVRFINEAPYEQIPHLCGQLRRKADQIVDALCPLDRTGPGSTERFAVGSTIASTESALRQFYEHELRPFLGDSYARGSPLANPRVIETRLAAISALSWSPDAIARIAALGTVCEDRRQLGEQERLHQLLHGWLLLHVPLSVMLLVLGLAHAVMSLYY